MPLGRTLSSAHHNEVETGFSTGFDLELARADDFKTVALVEASGGLVVFPHVEVDGRRSLHQRVRQGGLHQQRTGTLILVFVEDIETAQFLVTVIFGRVLRGRPSRTGQSPPTGPLLQRPAQRPQK